MDKRLRALQRKQLVAEMESRDNTFNPAINKNSTRIVERLNKERMEESGGAGAPVPSSRVTTAKRALTAALAAGLPLAAAAQVSGLPTLDARLARSLGRSYLPGHEEETFHPKINPRSAAIKTDESDVYTRLYAAVTAARASKGVRSPGGTVTEPAHGAGGSPRAGAGAGAGAGASAGAGAGADAPYPVDEHGEPLPGHPHFFNVAAFDAGGAHDFILRRLVPASTLAAAASAAAAAAGR